MKDLVNAPVLGQSHRQRSLPREFAIVLNRRSRFTRRDDTRVQDAGES
jgi:hypothetical protein